MNFRDIGLKSASITGTLKKRVEILNFSKRFHRPWGSARIRKNVFGINFHFYRKPATFRMNDVDFKCLFNKKKRPPFGIGLSSSKWEYRISRICPIQFAIRDKWSDICYEVDIFPRKIKDWYYDNIYYRLFPGNTFKIKTLSRHYHDERELLIHAVFQVISNFVESHPEKYVDYSQDDWKSWWAECKEIYKWWKRYDKIVKSWEKRHDLNRKALYEVDKETWLREEIRLDKEQSDELEKMLIRAIKIRDGLWF
jgi:hypothetical protein